MEKIVLVSGCRTAIGTFMGSLSGVDQIDLGAVAVKEAVKRAGISPEKVDEVIVGNVGQIAQSGFIARAVSLKAGLPRETTAYSVNRQCGSGLQALVDAMLEIQTGNAKVVVACGTENMSQLPYYIKGARAGLRMGHQELEDGLIDILTWPLGPYHNGMTAEAVAEKFKISREEQDAFALESQRRAIAAIDAGKFKEEIIPVEAARGKDKFVFDTDEHPRRGLTMDKLAKLRPAFKEGGSVTAANSSGINDGAAAVVMMSESAAKELGLKPLMELASWAVAGYDDILMGYTPYFSTRKLMEKTGLGVEDFDLVELNEAFASQSVAVVRDLGLDPAKVNVNGGAIALGHPVGASGCILPVKLMYEMKRSGAETGLVAMCIGGGQGISAFFRNLQ
ncbi:MAG: thiolase family protein [Treponema sp.]|nr:thiolase family protein [Treponema sp.]